MQTGANSFPTRASRPWIESWYMSAASGFTPAAFANSSLPWQLSHRFAISRRSAGTFTRAAAVGSYAASFFTEWIAPWHEVQVGPATFVSSRSHREWSDFCHPAMASACSIS